MSTRRATRLRWVLLEETGNSRIALWCSSGIAVLAAAARIPGAVRDAFWEDEVSSAHVLIQSTPWGMLHQIARTEATPPLWYALGWLTNRFGLSPYGNRFFSVLAGALLAGATVLVARRLLPLSASVLAGVLVALGWQFVMHGRELRAYELFVFASVLFAWILLHEPASSHPAGGRRYVLAIAVALGSLTNYFFLLTVAAALVWLWMEPDLRACRRRITRQIGLGLIPLLIWSPILVHQYLGGRFSWVGSFTLRGVIDVYWELFAQNLPTGAGNLLLPLLVLAAVIAGCVLLARISAAGRLLALMAVVPVLLTAIAWLAGAHVFDPRNLIGAGPFAAIALATLPTRLPRPLGYAVGLAAAAVMTVAVIDAESTPPTPYDKISDLLVAEGWQPNDPIVLFGTFSDFFAYRSPLEWYLPHEPYLTLGEPKRASRVPRDLRSRLVRPRPPRSPTLRAARVAPEHRRSARRQAHNVYAPSTGLLAIRPYPGRARASVVRETRSRRQDHRRPPILNACPP